MDDTQVTTQTINAVADNLADKIGIAAEKLLPLAETVIAETSWLGIAYCIVGVVFVLSAAGTIRRMFYFCSENTGGDKDMAVVGVGCLAGAFILGAFLAIDAGLCRWLAPHLYLVEKVLG